VDLRRQHLGRGRPIPQGDRHRDDPLARRHPRDYALHQVGGGLRHTPAGTRQTKPPPLAAEGQQQLLGAGVTAQPQKAMVGKPPSLGFCPSEDRYLFAVRGPRQAINAFTTVQPPFFTDFT
jgi:hypothetical protein